MQDLKGESGRIQTAADRRAGSNRRDGWRGGRRDTDWTNRPTGVTAELKVRPPAAWWQRLLRLEAARADIR
jgi:hypothetical protein